ncbi:MAG: hypothetical protein OXG24_03630 [Gammaproteobacteria bacterium]|nr:hypothetical protein [Gammaproteobacteria bacterium]
MHKDKEHLEALLTGLEDEVLRDEADLSLKVDSLRAEMEELILQHGVRSKVSKDESSGTKFKTRVQSALEKVSRWFGSYELKTRENVRGSISMAFSVPKSSRKHSPDRATKTKDSKAIEKSKKSSRRRANSE